jgi:hypothetical protein
MATDDEILGKKQTAAGISSAMKKLKRVKRQLSSMSLFREAKEVETCLLKLKKIYKSCQDD